MRLSVVFLRFTAPANVLITFLFYMKHSHLLTGKTIQEVNNFLRFLHGMNELLWAILHMLEATIGVWL